VIAPTHAATLATADVRDEDPGAYRAGQIVAYVTMAAIGLYYLIKWLRSR
jgi:hypothetical protein